jgi:hypothetical protein
MSSTASNAKRTIVTKGTAHVAMQTAPDMCLIPGQATPVPFPNYVKSEKLLKGQTTKTFIDNKPVWTSIGELGPLSEPAHAGTAGGVKSHTYRFEAKPTSYSSDVFFEGNPVVRAFDTTTQNHDNTVGLVVPEALFALLMALGGYDIDCLTDAAVPGTPTMLPGPT